MNINPDLVGEWSDKKCPKCGSILLVNNRGDEWCSFVECDYDKEEKSEGGGGE